ncbi:MAG: hypothetical protein ACK5QW_06515 [Cyanobacteriota bacterium]|jgi:hypothetical protein
MTVSQPSPPSDGTRVVLKDLILRLSVANHAPPTLNLGFLQGAGIISGDWALAQEAICSPEGAQLVFDNGLILLAQGQILSGQERLDTPAAAAPQLAELLARYCQALPRLAYQGLQTVLRAVILYENDPEGASRTLRERLLQPGDWQTIGQEPMQATLQFAYRLEDQTLTLTVAPAEVRQEGEPFGSALVFAAAFEQQVLEGERLPQIQGMLRGWTGRRDQLLEWITTRFKLP